MPRFSALSPSLQDLAVLALSVFALIGAVLLITATIALVIWLARRIQDAWIRLVFVDDIYLEFRQYAWQRSRAMLPTMLPIPDDWAPDAPVQEKPVPPEKERAS